MPTDLDEAIKAVQDGTPHPVTVGRINGHPFLEVAAIGMFGEALQLGEAAKDMVFGKLRSGSSSWPCQSRSNTG